MTRRDLLEVLGAAAIGGVLRQRQQAFVPDVEIVLTAAPSDAQILSGPRTSVWRFTGRLVKGPAGTVRANPGSYLGPTLYLRRGQKVRIRFENRLPDASIVHWHGLDVPAQADGHPRLAVSSGADYLYEFEVNNRAGTYWYHPHPHMQTGPQVYRGLAGLLIVTDDEEEALGLPADEQDLVCVLQDRRFDDANQFVYSTAMMDMETGVLGDRVLVNGQTHPQWSLATRAYRLRVLNGSNARIYKLAWSDGTPLTVIGTDGGLLPQPQVQQFVTLAPAQRADLWLDLTSRPVGTRISLRSEEFELADAGLVMGRGRGAGFGRTGGQGAGMGGSVLDLGSPVSLLSLTVTRSESVPARLPNRLSDAIRAWRPAASAPVRRIPLSFQRMQWFLGGRVFAMDDVAKEETVDAGSTHHWEFVNEGGPMGMQMAHPIHLHGRQFRIVSRRGGNPTNTLRSGLVEAGLMDTALVLPNETVRIEITFSRFTGLFLYHCHILEHEDMGMMRNYRIV